MRVGHVVATLKATGRQHIIVADGNRVCGVFSTQRIARQLGIDFGSFTVAGTFSEIETALASWDGTAAPRREATRGGRVRRFAAPQLAVYCRIGRRSGFPGHSRR